MSIVFNGDTSKALERTTGLFDYNAGYTITFWLYVTTWAVSDGSATVIDIGNSGTSGKDQLRVSQDIATNKYFTIYTHDGDVTSATTGSAHNFAENTWYFISFSRNSTASFHLTVDGVVEIDAFLGGDVSSRAAPNYFDIGRTQAGPTQALSAKICAMKVFSEIALDANQIAKERYTILPVAWIDPPSLYMYGFYPMFPGATERAMDYGPNSHSFTEVGSLTDDEPAPVSWGTVVLTTPNIDPIIGTTAWGQETGVTETNVRTYGMHWTGTGSISGTSDAEKIELNAGEYMESELVNTGVDDFILLQNFYGSGDTITIKYRHGASVADCLAASWTTYTGSFTSLGYVQVRIESTL